MEINNKVEYSKRDLIRKIILPSKLTPDLSQLIGIILGDGNILCKKYAKTTMYRLSIAGSYSEDFAYYKEKINPLFLRLFNLNFKFLKQRKDELALIAYSKAISRFFMDIGIQSGRKVEDNCIPMLILNSRNDLKKGFIRGVFDTEASMAFKKNLKGLHSKPIISIKMKSEIFIIQLKRLLEQFNLEATYYKEACFDKKRNKTYVGHRIELAGKKNLLRFIRKIGFDNPRHLTKIKIWKRFGFCPPRLNYQQRLDILSGKLNPFLLETRIS